jgi:hypothetical protein
MCRNFTYEVVSQRRRLKAIKKNVSSKKKLLFYFLTEFFRYFFFSSNMKPIARGLQFVHTFQKHPVYVGITCFLW